QHHWLANRLRESGVRFKQLANAFLTCAAPDRLQALANSLTPRAICDDLIPALVAARTALTCPRVNETFAISVCPLCLDDDCFATGSSVGFVSALGGNLPRCFASWPDVVMSRSSSVSVRCLTAVGRSLGRARR